MPASSIDKCDEAHDEYDYVFGFGSIINTDTHAPWLRTCNGGGGSSVAAALRGRHARIKRSFGYRRAWNFRSNTGFTALGISRSSSEDAATDINGIIFRVGHASMPGFDRREVGYDRVEIAREHFELLPRDVYGKSLKDETSFFDGIKKTEKLWVYIPQAAYCAEADESHPLLQSYVDTVLQGCLEWGGADMAREFVTTTSGWSPFFLNDTPSSRRPWLFRKEYETIDRILSQTPGTHYADRRHPEEFASAFLVKMMRGTWSVPRRNSRFTGRDVELGQIHARLTDQRTDSVAKLEVAGMGGVGKTQLCTEYCYRYFGSFYGLVIWLNAEGAETLVACYRQLMADTTDVDVKDNDTEEVIGEVKARLFRSKVPWLLVFDNLEDRSLLDKFLPHGAGGTLGHVLVTTRHVEMNDQTLMLGCFSPSESVQLLCRSSGSHNISGEENIRAAEELASHLGHLPLALSMAAAYMQRCDVVCSEYLARYVRSDSSRSLLGHRAGQLAEYPLGVAASLSLSLRAIGNENSMAVEILNLLCWLGPDQITKAVMRSLLKAKNMVPPPSEDKKKVDVDRYERLEGRFALLSLGLILGRQALSRNPQRSRACLGVGLMAALSISAAASIHFLSMKAKAIQSPAPVLPSNHESESILYADEYEQTDVIWNILKSYSILVVKAGRGSIHRLLSEALRASQSDHDARRNLQICTCAIQQLWVFKPERTDSWQESEKLLEHVKAVVSHASKQQHALSLEASILSKEAGVFSAMVLNRFEESQISLELSLTILDGAHHTSKAHTLARAETLHELGRVHRYQGNFSKSEEALNKALDIRKRVAKHDLSVADTLHELGVLETKKHKLESAGVHLQQALDLRRSLQRQSSASGEMEANCAATLHQLAAVQVSKKPPSLSKAESLLQEALTLRMQIGQRAATLKQLARVSIRQGLLTRAESYLGQALELYVELYGENSLHINVAAVHFQLGALAFQREQLEQAWVHFSECLRIRRSIYSYARPVQRATGKEEANPAHLDVSLVLHELGCVAFADDRVVQAEDMFKNERKVLGRLQETATSQAQRILQARLTNLTWLRKCAKGREDDEMARLYMEERSALKRNLKHLTGGMTHSTQESLSLDLQKLSAEAMRARACVRRFALADPAKQSCDRNSLLLTLKNLEAAVRRSPACKMQEESERFYEAVSESLTKRNMRSIMLDACDALRDILRDHGLLVHDEITSTSI